MTTGAQSAWSGLAGLGALMLSGCCTPIEFGCRTATAIEALPVGYWMATEALVVGAILDVLDIVRWIVGL